MEIKYQKNNITSYSKFKEFVKDKKDLAHERYVFNNRDKKEGETFLSFLINNISQAGKCGFDHLKNSMIGNHIISSKCREHTKAKLET